MYFAVTLVDDLFILLITALIGSFVYMQGN